MESKPFIGKVSNSLSETNIELDMISGSNFTNFSLVLKETKKEIIIDGYKWLINIEGCENEDSPSIVTLHDCGINHSLCFNGFFNYPQMLPLLNNFRIIHIDFPGHEENSQSLYSTYPSLEQLSEYVLQIINSHKLKIKNFFGFGVGFGANIFLRIGLLEIPNLLGLILVNTTSSSIGIIDKLSNFLLSYISYTTSNESLLRHLIGESNRCNPEIYHLYSTWLSSNSINSTNVVALMNSYNQRCSLSFSSPNKANNQFEKGDLLSYPVLLISGDYSPYLEDTIDVLSLLNCKRTQFLKVSNATGAVLDERPSVVANASFLFLQGHGYLIHEKLPCIKEDENQFNC